MIVNNL